MMTSESSAMCRVSDEEMRFFQHRARDLLLLRREDHAWKEFCRTCATCDCCSCLRRDVQDEQATKPPPKPVRNMPSRTLPSVQSGTLPQTLNEIKSKLERIDLALSQKTETNKIPEVANRIFPETKLLGTFNRNVTVANPLNVKRMELIESCLKQSIQRLQSSAALKGARTPSLPPPKKKSSGFFLPHELQQQRARARSAYLKSLSKSKSTLSPSSSIVKGKNPKKEIHAPSKAIRPRVIPNTRPKNTLQPKTKEKEGNKTVTTSQLTGLKDQNIETAVDGIVDDLMGETVLLLNLIKQRKSGTAADHHTQGDKEDGSKISSVAMQADKESVKSQPLQNWAAIRQTLFNLKTPNEEKSHAKNSSNSPQEDCDSKPSGPPPSKSQSTLPKTSVSFASEPTSLKSLFIDPETWRSIERHRKEYARYLERVNRGKKASFDPHALANMISECLLDECIESVSKELLDVPGSLITDLYKQEFLQNL